MIYFIQAEGVGHIKIGFTEAEDAAARLVSLQIGSPVLLKLLGVIPGTMEDEKNLHRRFAAHRVTGEWFKPAPDLLALVPGSDSRSCGGVEIAERSVTIRVLTVGRKQFTKSLLEQLPKAKCIDFEAIAKSVLRTSAPGSDWHAIADGFDLGDRAEGDVWGWVSGGYSPFNNRGDNGPFRWIIFELDGLLYKQFEFHASVHRQMNRFGPDDLLRAESYRLEFLTNRLGERQDEIPGWDADDQLFIGV